jgi:hypothetical protein
MGEYPREEFESDEAQLLRQWYAIAEKRFESLRFEDLLSLAENLCLKSTPSYTQELDQSTEAKIIEKLGTRGIKIALQFIDDAIWTEEESPTSDTIITADGPLCHPNLYGSSLNRDALSKAEQFGAQLMRESIDVLGADAPSTVERF